MDEDGKNRGSAERKEYLKGTYKHYYGVGLYPKVNGKILQNKKQRGAFWKYYSGFNMENSLEMTKT